VIRKSLTDVADQGFLDEEKRLFVDGVEVRKRSNEIILFHPNLILFP